MHHVFISYSRKDKAFASRLYTALVAKGLNVWIDWEDIPPSVDWMREIEQGIRSADFFLLIISPDLITSRVCYIETKYALSLNKRFVPVLHRDVTVSRKFSRRQTDVLTPMDQVYSALGVETEAESMYAMISPHNWIMFRDTDDFDHSVGQLIDTLHNDIDQISFHTKLLEEAYNWHTQGQPNNHLLTGQAYQTAKAWINSEPNPQPTEIQVEYVKQSATVNTHSTAHTQPMTIRCGIDMIEIIRVERGCNRFGDKYLNRFFTAGEREDCNDKPHRLAARLAAKEAVSKALGTGIGAVSWLDIEIRCDRYGRPVLHLYGQAAQVSDELGLSIWDISLTHTRDYASAIAIAR